MSSKEDNANTPKKQPSNELNKNSMNSIQNYSDEKNHDYNELLKPIPINLKLPNNQNGELTTLGNSTATLANLSQEPNIPIIYPQIQFHERQQPLYNEEEIKIFKPKKFKSKEIIENNNLLTNKDKPCCSCTKTKCIKKYCECFSNKMYCNNCLCQDCMNKYSYLNSNSSNDIKYILDNDTIMCTCTKSGCNKKYCECFKAGKKCNEKCRCMNCQNISNIFNISKKNKNISDKNKNYKIDEKKVNNNTGNNIGDNISLDEIKKDSRKSSLSESSTDNIKIQRISVFINKNQTLINVEKFSKEEMNLLSKKRENYNRYKYDKK